MGSNVALRIVQAAVARVLDRPLVDVEPSTPLATIGLDHLALAAVLADVADVLGPPTPGPSGRRMPPTVADVAALFPTDVATER